MSTPKPPDTSTTSEYPRDVEVVREDIDRFIVRNVGSIQAADHLSRLVDEFSQAIVDSVKPKTFRVGERVAAYNYRGEKLGRGRVTSSQRDNGPYMKVRLDGPNGQPGLGQEVIVPQSKAKRLIRK